MMHVQGKVGNTDRRMKKMKKRKEKREDDKASVINLYLHKEERIFFIPLSLMMAACCSGWLHFWFFSFWQGLIFGKFLESGRKIV